MQSPFWLQYKHLERCQHLRAIGVRDLASRRAMQGNEADGDPTPGGWHAGNNLNSLEKCQGI